MQLRWLGTDSKDGDSPTLWETDSDEYIVQGYSVTDPQVLAQLNVPEGEADWWLFDDSLIAVGEFDGHGRPLGSRISTDAALLHQCISVRDRVWPSAIPHTDYRPR